MGKYTREGSTVRGATRSRAGRPARSIVRTNPPSAKRLLERTDQERAARKPGQGERDPPRFLSSPRHVPFPAAAEPDPVLGHGRTAPRDEAPDATRRAEAPVFGMVFNK